MLVCFSHSVQFIYNMHLVLPAWLLDIRIYFFRHCVSQRMDSGAGDCTETGPALEDAASTFSPAGTKWQGGVSVLLRGYGTRNSSGSGQKSRGGGAMMLMHFREI